MSVFKKGARLGDAAGARFKIKITTEDGQSLYWHKRGQLHVVEDDVARTFVESFKTDVFRVLPDGSFVAAKSGQGSAVKKVERERA